MREVELTQEQKHQLYEKLMAAIFGERQDQRLPFCYPYIIKDGEEVSLEEGVKRVLETLPNPPDYVAFHPYIKAQWTKENQIKLLTLRFGLKDGKVRRLKEIGREFNVTRERVRQMKEKILRRLRHPNRSEPLRKFLIPLPEEMQELRVENKRLRKENEMLRKDIEFEKRFGLSPEQFEERGLERNRNTLLKTLQKAASLYPGKSQVNRAYNCLVRNGINSLSQLQVLMNIDEGKIRGLRNLGEKSFWLICKALEIAEEEEAES